MSKSLRLLGLAAVFSVLAAGTAAAQTVLLKGASAGDAIEVFVNGKQTGTGTVGAGGQGTVVSQLPLNATNKAELDSRVYVDSCPKVRRIHVVDRNLQAPARDEGCERREIGGIFWVRQRSTMVFDVAGPIPTLLLRQGEYDPNARAGRESPRGLVLFAGGGWGTLKDLDVEACGDIGDCDGKGSGGAWQAGAQFWLTRYLAVEGTYLKPRKASFDGNGTNFRFNYRFDSEFFTAGGLLAAPIGAVRLYGRAGAAFHRASVVTEQTNDALTYTTDGVTYNVPGGSQSLEAITEGWGWMTGGGIEGWVSSSIALFADFSVAKMKGQPKSGTDLDMDNMFMGAIVGLRFKLF